MQGPEFISVEEAGEYLRTRGDLRVALTASWFFLPKEKSTCMTSEWLCKVLKGDYWVPKYNELKLRPCMHPPVKDRLFEYLQSEASLQAIQLGFDKTHSPDKDWMLAVLSTLKEDHFIFAKDYRPEPVLAKKAVLSQVMIPNHNGFFQGLPRSKKRGSIFKQLCSVDQINRAKRQRLIAHQRNVQDQLARLDIAKNGKGVAGKGTVEIVFEDEEEDTGGSMVDAFGAVH